MKKTIFALVAFIALFPIGHLLYARYHVPDTPVDTAEWAIRTDALARAKVFIPNGPAIAAEFPFGASEIECRYVPKETSGTTPKFDCELADGSVLKVKYGLNPEIPGEAAATRLLAMLGFGADHTAIVPRLRCHGCPISPYRQRQVAEWFFVAGLADRFIDYGKYTDFTNVAVERKLAGRSVEVGAHRGWAWYELTSVDPAKGGASRAELDALRLMAVFLAHWDNKSANQRIVCLGDNGEDGPAPCAEPLLIMQDLGATFGPKKVDYLGWKFSPIWRDATGCTVSMAHLPYRGATFQDVEITEEGRAMLAARLSGFPVSAVEQLLLTSNFPDAETGEVGAKNVKPWVDVFEAKRKEIVSRSCGAAPSPNRQ